MTIEEARSILGKNYDNIPDDKIDEWINASNGLAEIFMQQMEHLLIKKDLDNDHAS